MTRNVSNMARQADIADLSLFNVPYILATSKRTSWRRETFATGQAIANVLTDEGLTTVNLRDRFAGSPEQFDVKFGDLTTKGFDFACTGFQRWLENQDRWKTERTVAKLEAALRKQLDKFRK